MSSSNGKKKLMRTAALPLISVMLVMAISLGLASLIAFSALQSVLNHPIAAGSVISWASGAGLLVGVAIFLWAYLPSRKHTQACG